MGRAEQLLFSVWSTTTWRKCWKRRGKKLRNLWCETDWGRGGGGKKGKGLGLHISWQCQWRRIHLDLEVTSYFGTVSKVFFSKIEMYIRLYNPGIPNSREKNREKIYIFALHARLLQMKGGCRINAKKRSESHTVRI